MECLKCKKSIPEDALFCPYCGKKQTVAQPRKRKKRANGMGTICKKSGNRVSPWEAQKNGVYIGLFATKFEAEKALERVRELRTDEMLNMTFSDVYAKWLPEHSREISGKGVEGYTLAFKHCSALHEIAFRKLRTSDFQAVITAMEEKGLSKSSCEKVVQLFGQLSKWAMREEITHTNYAQFVTIVAKQKTTKQPFTSEQIEAIRTSGHPAAQIAMILLGTGCRPNELFSVPTENCYENYFISGSKTEAGRNRVIPVSPIGFDAYSKLRESAVSSGAKHLIDAYGGNHKYVNYAKRDWKELMNAVGIEGMTPYNCRHTFTTLAVQSNVKPEILQKILGHADYSTTVEVYTHLDADEVIREAQRVTVTDKLQTREI